MADEATTETAADESTAGSETTNTDSATETETQGAEALGDAGKKALDAMKTKWKAADADRKRLADEFAALKAQVEGKEREHAATLEAQRVKDEALAAANQRILKAEVRVAAAGKLADPQDALRFLDLSEFEVGSDGEVDGKAVAAAIADLIKTKPYLAVQDGRRFQGDADGGARNEPPAKTVDEQIAEAEKSGNWRAASKLKAAQLLKPSTT